jgi:hypothetical protein
MAYYDDIPVTHLAAYSPDELRMDRTKLVYELLGQMMHDLSSDTPPEVACLLSHTHALGWRLYQKARTLVEARTWIEEEEEG